jgi:hypothetical protein
MTRTTCFTSTRTSIPAQATDNRSASQKVVVQVPSSTLVRELRTGMVSTVVDIALGGIVLHDGDTLNDHERGTSYCNTGGVLVQC